MQFPTTGYFQSVHGVCIFYTQANVCIQFFIQSVTQVTGCYEFSFCSRKRTVIYGECHGNCRFGNFYERQCFRFQRRADGIADHDIFDTAECNNAAHTCFFHFYTLQAVKFIQLCDTNLFLCFCIVHIQYHHFVIDMDGTIFNFTNTDSAYIFAVIDGGDQCLQRRFHITFGSWNVVDDGFKQGFHIPFSCFGVFGSIAASCRREYKRRIQLIIICIQFHKQFQNLVHHICWTCFWSVHFIYTNHNGVVQFQCFAQYKFCLGHRAFKSVYHQYNTVYHFQYTFYFAAEVRVSRCINDIDFGIAVMNGSILRQNGNAAFSFDIAAVHNTFLYHLIGTENTALAQHLVYQCGFAMVYVSNNGNISNVFNSLFHKLISPSPFTFHTYIIVFYHSSCFDAINVRKKMSIFRDFSHKKALRHTAGLL
ncbi:uncharacterized protein BN684_00859 [Clostridium sp. CAG:505]|nr:uncharacterized protein BN684_00859 [Clostridium sp. CAG:505]